ncbi:MAG: sigma-70 family RNA polymerase sigma factor [Spongiibacteraceae bacterium]
MSELSPTTQKDPQQLVSDLLAVAQQRSKPAFERLFDHFVPMLRAFSLAAQPGASLFADEIAQEVMIKIWNKAHLYNPEVASVSTWVFTLARNARIDYFRKNGRFQSDIDPETIWSELVDEHADPFQSALQRRSEELISRELAALPAEQQQVLHKVYMEGKSHTEAAEELNLPLGTVKSRVRLALKKLAISIKR